MMFHADITFVLALIALAMGTLILIKAKKHADVGVKPCQFLGYLVVVLAIIVLLFSGYNTIRYPRFMCAKRTMMRRMMGPGPVMQPMQQGKMMRKKPMPMMNKPKN